jgi:hypothetical protein
VHGPHLTFKLGHGRENRVPVPSAACEERVELWGVGGRVVFVEKRTKHLASLACVAETYVVVVVVVVVVVAMDTCEHFVCSSLMNGMCCTVDCSCVCVCACVRVSVRVCVCVWGGGGTVCCNDGEPFCGHSRCVHGDKCNPVLLRYPARGSAGLSVVERLAHGCHHSRESIWLHHSVPAVHMNVKREWL